MRDFDSRCGRFKSYRDNLLRNTKSARQGLKDNEATVERRPLIPVAVDPKTTWCDPQFYWVVVQRQNDGLLIRMSVVRSHPSQLKYNAELSRVAKAARLHRVNHRRFESSIPQFFEEVI